MNLPQPPEGVLDPKHPWHLPMPKSPGLWGTLKARLTGRPSEYGHYSSNVNISEAEADTLIANMKKDPRGYPQMDQTSGNPLQWLERQEKYQKWLVESYLENPFREEVNKKIEEAEIEARLNEIQEQKKRNKEPAPIPVAPAPAVPTQEEEQKVLDSEQEAIEEETTKITTELDSVEEEEKQQQSEQDSVEQPEPESTKLSADFEAISDSLLTIKGSLSSQISDLGSIERDNIKSLSALEGIKQLFQAQTDIIRREIDLAEKKASEKRLEQTQTVSATTESTDLTATNKAEGVIQGIDGPVLTVKTTEGEFRQGEKITQGGGGGGLFDMLKGIAGKFLTKGKGGGGSPVKMSAGGFLQTPYPAFSGGALFPSTPMPSLAAGGTFAPGVYDKPTRGNLGPGQAVVPLNRNYGKKIFSNDLTQTVKLQQPLADVMVQPLKAIGLSIISVAGNFLRLLGPLAGFFTPYISGLVNGFAAVLGVPVAVISALLGGPAYAAMEDQDKQQNIFAKLWSDLMKTLGFNFGGDDTENKKQPASGNPNFEGSEGGEKTMNFLMSQGLTPEQAAGVAGNLMQESHFDPNADNGTHHGIAQWDKQHRWPRVAEYITSIGRDPATLEGQLMGLKWEAEQRGDWKQIQQTKTTQDAALKWLERFEISGEKPGMPGFDNRMTYANGLLAKYGKVSAESGGVGVMGNSPLGPVTDWAIVDGPDSGYKVSDNLTMHGREAYLQHKNGFTILPIENNQYSLTNNPQETLSRWQELLGSGQSVIGNKSSAARGTRGGLSKDYKYWELFYATKAAYSQIGTSRQGSAGSGAAPSAATQQPITPLLRKSAPVTTPKNNTPKQISQTDLMMEQYNQLVAAGKHSEAKDLGMKIWNKTYRKTDKGIERIPTTPTAATNTIPSKNTPSININVPVAPQQIIVPIPASDGIPVVPQPIRSVQQELELMTAKTLC